ncbi:MAG TPA: CsgG/HfaB family protein [bacterium]|jgi:curli biogenesis system outer membrane secretion channel CsgG
MSTRAWAGIIAVTVMLITGTVSAQTPRKAVMVVDFADRAGGWTYTRETVTVRIINRLRDDPNIRVLSRDQVQDALKQARLETSGILDWQDVQKVAKTLSADYVLMGEVTTFDQQYTGGCLPIVGCAYTVTATVNLRGKVLDAAAGAFVAEPTAESRKQQSSISVWVGYWWGSVSIDNFDSQLIGKATLEAVDSFVTKVRPTIK